MADKLMTHWQEIFVSVWVLVALIFAYKKGWFQLPVIEGLFPFSLRNFFIVGGALIFAIAVYIASFFVGDFSLAILQKSPLSSFLSSLNDSERMTISQLIGLTLALFCLRIILSFLPEDIRSLVLGESGGVKKWIKGVFYGALFYPIITILAWCIGFFIALYTNEARGQQEALQLLSGLLRGGALFWCMAGYMVFVVPYVEELLFRGFFQTFLGGLVHPALSLILTSAAFSFFHVTAAQKASNFEIVLGLFVFSLIASQVRAKEGSLAASMGFHASFNALSLTFYFLAS